jgi:hypothetical protein
VPLGRRKPEWVEQLEKQPCTCERCCMCEGTGGYYVDSRGRFQGVHRSDDMEDLETCEFCGGSGVTDECSRCMDLETWEMEDFRHVFE